MLLDKIPFKLYYLLFKAIENWTKEEWQELYTAIGKDIQKKDFVNIITKQYNERVDFLVEKHHRRTMRNINNLQEVETKEITTDDKINSLEEKIRDLEFDNWFKKEYKCLKA